ncbi:C6 zinc finger domain protein [Aspergillus terreus]|uniref:C6 zinc finger domain protein n=1 Tax=Aspergillus terreus TaxID=33178 RepID=A0A5M3ZCW3_ASPTE|nr:hypothetical protein ATETN484_0016002400 [Aspergillus terreus]GFF21453.1 C6 zinc finger domain protein [Aspergillus terreus]
MEDQPRPSPEPKVPRIERRRTVGETPSGTWTPRTKPVAIACERCRRRKIRCDGETPCATCRRFSLNCIRPQRGSEGQAALEQRVRQLEARIFELSTGFSNNQVLRQVGNGPTDSQGSPSLHLFTDLAALDYPDPHEPYGQLFLDSNPAPREIPRIEVVDYATPDFRMVDAGEELGQAHLESCLGFETSMSNMPTSVEIQALLELFFQTIPGLGYPLGRDMFQKFLDIIDDPSQVPSEQGDMYPVSMAKFHVYMAMAVGLRMKVDCRARELQLLETCYDVAVEQIRSRYFWAQPLAGEAAMLLMLFANASRQCSVS